MKIQYPGVAAAIRADLKNTELLATFLGLIGGLSPRRLSFDLRGAAQEIGERITEELDYRLEAANQTEFAELYRGHPFIHVPEVIGELCTDRVLTQELVQGKSWSEALAADQELRDSWAEAIHRFLYGSYQLLPRVQRRSAPRQLPLPRRRERELPRLRLRQAVSTPSRSSRLNVVHARMPERRRG